MPGSGSRIRIEDRDRASTFSVSQTFPDQSDLDSNGSLVPLGHYYSVQRSRGPSGTFVEKFKNTAKLIVAFGIIKNN